MNNSEINAALENVCRLMEFKCPQQKAEIHSHVEKLKSILVTECEQIPCLTQQANADASNPFNQRTPVVTPSKG